MINERIVNALAKRWGKSGVSFEELKSEACKCAMEAIVAFDPDKGASIDTLQWKYIDRGLRNFVHKEIGRAHV